MLLFLALMAGVLVMTIVNINFYCTCQGPAVILAPCQMDRQNTWTSLLGTQSITPVTQGTE